MSRKDLQMGIDVFNPPKFVKCYIDNYSDIQPQISKLRSFIFRGHRRADWSLKSSLEREYKKYPSCQSIEGAEHYSLKYFKERVHLYSEQIQNPSNVIGILVLMQHYGCPTRLVDFTWSFVVATYFAVREHLESKQDFCIWALNYPVLKQYTDDILCSKNKLRQIKDIIYKFPDFKKDGIIIVEPNKITKRMSVQQGLSIAQTNIGISFENNLYSALDIKNDPIEINLDELTQINQNIINNINIIKFTFNEKYIQQVRRYLLSSNITSESLFPDLEGMARTAVEHIFWQY